MKQVSYYVRSIDYLDSCLQDISRQLCYADSYAGILVSALAAPSRREELDGYLDKIAKKMPRANVIAALTEHEIINGHIMAHGVVVTFNIFAEAEVEVLAFDAANMDSRDMGEALLTHIDAAPDTAAVELVMADSSLDTVPLLKILSQTSPTVKFFGGFAYDSGAGVRGCVWANARPYPSGMVAVVFKGASLKVEVHASFGCQPLGRCMTITKMSDAYTVQEVDHAPVAEIYAKYLGIKAGEDFLADALAFPLYFYRNGRRLARHPHRALPDGSLAFGADLKVGEQVRLSYGDPAQIVRQAEDLAAKLAAFGPEGVFVTSCVARKSLLQQDAQKELNPCAQSPSTGLYAYGQIVRQGCHVMLSSMTLTVAAFREGVLSPDYVPTIPRRHPGLTRQTSILRHMAYFIRTSAAELETANARLAKLAHFDRLTNLLNRGEVETALSRGLSEAKNSREPFSVLILDIDDFKGINDTYGHDTGDAALRSVASILKESTRQSDAPGRWGGDEFFVVLPNTPLSRTESIAQRIRRAVSCLDILPGGRHITTSIGIAEARPDDTTISLFQRADRALYCAKKDQGKDAVASLP